MRAHETADNAFVSTEQQLMQTSTHTRELLASCANSAPTGHMWRRHRTTQNGCPIFLTSLVSGSHSPANVCVCVCEIEMRRVSRTTPATSAPPPADPPPPLHTPQTHTITTSRHADAYKWCARAHGFCGAATTRTGGSRSCALANAQQSHNL